MRKKDIYRFGIKTMVVIVIFAMVIGVFVNMNTQNVKAEVFEMNLQVSGDYGYEPDIAVDSAGNIYVVWEDGYVYCVNSTDGENNFGTAVTVSGTDQFCDYPSIAVDDNDNLHVAWFGDDDYIYYANSTDHGASFSTPVTVSDAEASGIDRTGIATFGNNVYIVWRTSEGWNLSLDKSINGGNFGTDVKVNDVDDSVRGDPAIAIGEDETIYVVWTDYDFRTCIANSTNHGASFGASVRVDDSGLDLTSYPSVAAIGSSTVYVAWSDWDTERIRVSKSTNKGATFNSSVPVSDTGTLLDSVSSIAVHPCGKIFVAWQDDKTSEDDIGTEIYFANSTDEGASFGTDVKVNDAPPIAYYDHKQPSLAVGNDTEAYVVWRDRRGDKTQIWFVKAPDATWPSKITDLGAVDVTANSITLNWTAPGDNFAHGNFVLGGEYDIRYSTSEITEVNWDAATPCTGEPSPNIACATETFTVPNLGNDTTYYFALKTADEIPNWCPTISNVASGKTLDDWAPDAVTNLVASDPTSNSIKLIWTAPGDNGNIGTATMYDIRYSTSEITDANWATATPVDGEPTPSIAGTTETFTVINLEEGTKYYFALKTRDEVPDQWSLLSNVVNKTTLVNHLPYAPTLTAPANDTWTNNNIPTFTWTFSDQDTGDIQGGYHVQINATLDWGAPAYDSGEVVSSTSSYTPTTAISDGIWYWRVRTKDNHDAWGNWSDPWVVKIDTALPVIDVIGVVNGAYYNISRMIEFSATDDYLDTVTATLNGADFTSGATVNEEDEYILIVAATDLAGNVNTTIIVFTIDKSAPAITITNVTDGAYYNTSRVIEFSVIDDYLDTVTATLNNAPFTSGSTASAEGVYYLNVTANDLAGNVATQNITFIIDKTLPVITITNVTDSAYYNTSRVIEFSATDNYIDIVTAVLNSVDFTSGATVSEEGVYTLIVNATDLAGNVNTTTIVFTIDNTLPTTNDNAPSGWQTSKPVIVSLTSGADLSGIAHTYYKSWLTTEGEPDDYTESTEITLNADGIWNIKYYSVDGAGNVEEYNFIQVKIDTTSPTAVTLEEHTDVTENSVTLTWSKNTDSDFKQYEVYKASKSDFSGATLVTTITDRNTTTYTVPDLSSGTKYYFKIKVVDNAGLSTESTQISAKTSAPPEEGMNWILIGGIIGIIVVIIVIAVAVIMVRKKKGKTPQNP